MLNWLFSGTHFHPIETKIPREFGKALPDATRKSNKPPVTYASAGVDLSQGDRTKQRIKYLAQKTFNKQVLGEIGGFGGLFRLDTAKYANPVLVSSADGVGTKLKVAFALGMHHTVGADLVNHCVNDVAVQGATPLFFLDYLAIGQLDDEVAQTVVSGVAEACRANGCALIGGETAQMPGFYSDGEYDLAGFIVGAVIFAAQENKRSIDAFHLRQALGLYVTGILFYVLFAILGSNLFYTNLPQLIILIPLLILWFLGFKSAMDGKETPLPLMGRLYQKLFAKVG